MADETQNEKAERIASSILDEAHERWPIQVVALCLCWMDAKEPIEEGAILRAIIEAAKNRGLTPEDMADCMLMLARKHQEGAAAL